MSHQRAFALCSVALLLSTFPPLVLSQNKDAKPAVAEEPIGAILEAFGDHSVVALGEGDHNNIQGANFRLALLRDPRFAKVVNDIVVECGNSLYQDVIDRFTAGEVVPEAVLKKVWQNTTQSQDIWDHGLYEQFFRAVRETNQKLQGRKLRALLGEPPFDWDATTNRDYADKWWKEHGLNARDQYPADLIQREVLAKGRRALIVYGDMHLQRRNLFSNFEAAPVPMLVESLERAGVKVFNIWVGGWTDLELFQPGSDLFNEPKLFHLKGTIPGSADFSTFYPVEMPRMRWVNGQRSLIPKEEWKTMPMENVFDAMLYLGHPLTITFSPPDPKLCADPEYIQMRIARNGTNWADDFRQRCNQPPSILPGIWRTYVSNGIAAALATLPSRTNDFPDGDSVLNRLSEVLRKRGKTADALAAARRNVELFPTAPGAHLALGAVYGLKGDKEAAASSYRQALKLDPDNKEAATALKGDLP